MATFTLIENLAEVRSHRTGIEPVRLPDEDIAHHLASENPTRSAGDAAEATFAAKNKDVRVGADTRLTYLMELEQDASAVKNIFQKMTERHSSNGGLYARIPAWPRRQYRMSWPERVTNFIYVLGRFGLAAFGVWVMGMYVRASGQSVDASSSWPHALAFGALLLGMSWLLSYLPDATDNLRIKRRIAIGLVVAAFIVFLPWVAASAYLFGLENASDGFSVNSLTAPAASVATSIFSEESVGQVMLFTHLIGDVLIIGALGAWSKIIGLKGRKTQFLKSGEVIGSQNAVDESAARKKIVTDDIAREKGIIAAYEAGLLAARSHAETRAASMLMVWRARGIEAITVGVIAAE